MDWFLNGYFQALTSLIAISGLALSIFNSWYMWKRDKKELYFEAFFLQSSDPRWGEVHVSFANKSLRPITIKEYGFKYVSSSASKMVEPKDVEIKKSHYDELIKLATSEQYSYAVYFVKSAGNIKTAESNFMLKAIPYAIDTEGQLYTGAPFKHPANFVFFLPKSDTDKDNKSEHQQG